MSCLYDEIKDFMLSYFPDYAEKAQDAKLQGAMDKYYAPDVMFDDGVVTSREQWYRICASHPDVVDVITPEKLCIDEKNLFVSAMVKSRPTVRATGEALLEIAMNAFYTLKRNEEGKLSIARIQVFTESDPQKINDMWNAYRMKH